MHSLTLSVLRDPSTDRAATGSGYSYSSLIFHRKYLCEAKHEMQSVFKFSDVPGTSDRCTSPVEASSDQEQYYVSQVSLTF